MPSEAYLGAGGKEAHKGQQGLDAALPENSLGLLERYLGQSEQGLLRNVNGSVKMDQNETRLFP